MFNDQVILITGGTGSFGKQAIRMTDLAESLALGMPHKIVGIRPGEKAKPVAEAFEYHSATNPHFLSVKELRQLNEQID